MKTPIEKVTHEKLSQYEVTLIWLFSKQPLLCTSLPSPPARAPPSLPTGEFVGASAAGRGRGPLLLVDLFS
jgi:hypothetical protein